MRPEVAIAAVDELVATHAERHYITTPEKRRMAAAVIAEMEPPANVPGITLRRVFQAFKKVRDERADRRRDA